MVIPKDIRVLIIAETSQDADDLKRFVKEIDNQRFILQLSTMDRIKKHLLNGELPQVILLDLTGFEEEELEVLIRVRGLARDIPIVVLTQIENEDIALEMVKLGAQESLGKDHLDPHLLKRSLIYSIERNNLKKTLQNTLQSKNKLFSIISHDLRSPFFSLMETTKFLADNLERYSPDKLREFILTLHGSAANTYKMVESLLQWAGTQTDRIEYKPTLTEIYPIALEAKMFLMQQAQNKSIDVNVDIDKELMGFIDKDLINTVLRNLISNALKFTKPQGKITLDGEKQGDNIIIRVEDTGIGMNLETQKKLFNIEEKTTTRGTNGESGSGLGLVVCNEFVKKNKGTIKVSSQEGIGTCFTITLPAIRN